MCERVLDGPLCLMEVYKRLMRGHTFVCDAVPLPAHCPVQVTRGDRWGDGSFQIYETHFLIYSLLVLILLIGLGGSILTSG